MSGMSGRLNRCQMSDESRCHRQSFFFSSRRRHTRLQGDWSSDVCSSDLETIEITEKDLASLAEKDLTKLHVHDSSSKELLAQSVDTDYDDYHKPDMLIFQTDRSEERRVGKECRSTWSPNTDRTSG